MNRRAFLCSVAAIVAGHSLDPEDPLRQVARYKAAWTARMDAGYYGRILPEEEGRSYAGATMRDGIMRLEA
jgi:hypothetical protein